MTFEFKLSKSSKKKLLKLGVAGVPDYFTLGNLNAWLRNKGSTFGKKDKFILESLKLQLSNDLKAHFEAEDPDQKKEKRGLLSRVMFGGLFHFLMIAGICLEGIEGVNGIGAILVSLSSFITIPFWITVGLSFVFAAVSISVFCAFELTQVAKHFGISFKFARCMLDIYVDQLALTRAIQLEICSKIKDANTNELEDYKALLITLEAQYSAIDNAREIFEEDLNHPARKIAKKVSAVTGGILFAAASYFTISSFVLAAAIFGHFIFIPACVAALVGFGFYWVMQRPYMENMIARMMGLNKKKINILANKEAAKADRIGLASLNDQIETKLLLKRKENEESPHVAASAEPSSESGLVQELDESSSITKNGFFRNRSSTAEADDVKGPSLGFT